ncbi:MAG: gliding motility-associated C-terminal domain-containing protein [Cytophagaceae bacterium]|nr:gliding motility-associated C-terminal domain-containing protein [Cytophagaceae bacterium]
MKKVYNLICSVVVLMLLVGTNKLLKAEGTEQIQPVEAEPYSLLINRSGGLSIPFASYTPNTHVYQSGTSPADYRLSIRVCNNNERVKLGFFGNEPGTFYRIKNPAGTVVFGPNKVPFLLTVRDVANNAGRFQIRTTANHNLAVGDKVTISGVVGNPGVNGTFFVNTIVNASRFTINVPFAGAYVSGGQVLDANAGRIDTWAQAIAGPASVVGASGYFDTTFVPGVAGDYYIEFNRADRNNFANNQITLRYFDIQVVSAANAMINGRLHSKSWYLANDDDPFKGSFYVYSNDGIVTKINNSQIQPYWFSISCNATGVSNTGNPSVDRMSVNGPQLYPSYEIFLNDPDIACYPTGTFGRLNVNPSVSGCGANRCLNINVDKSGNIIILLDLGGLPNVFDDPMDRQIAYFVTPAQVNTDICVPWDGLNGQGNPIVGGSNINIRVDFLNGITHLPLFDCEDNRNGFIITLERPAGPAPRVFWDDSNVLSGTATDGLTNSVNGCAAPSATIGCHRWRNRGDNACPPCSETINSWWYANIDTRSITYLNHEVDVDANTSLPGTSIANNSFKSCKTNATISLNGSFTSDVAVSGFWSRTGSGTFANANSPITTYTPSPADFAAGSVILWLSSNPTAPPNSCPTERDSLRITFVDATIANAGTDVSVCANNSTAVISGASSSPVSSTILWSGGAGTYVPNNSTLALTYNPTAAEIAAGFVDLTLRVNPTDPTCAFATDVVRINITSSPTANAGADQTTCANNSVATLSGSVGAGSTGAWSSTPACVGCFSNPASLTSTYTPSTANITAGTVTLTLTASKPGCTSVTDNMVLTIKPSPVVNAGPNQLKCRNNNVATLVGSTSNSTSTFWTSSSGCNSCFSSTTSLTPTYTPNATDLANGSVTLTLNGVSAGCLNATSSMTITYTASPTINAGSDRIVCPNNACLTYNVTTTGATGVIWSVGTGTHVPNNTSASGSYCLSAAEVSNGFAILVVNTTGVGNCNQEDDTIFVFLDPMPTVDAGLDNTVCANNPTISLAGNVSSNISSFSWSSLSASGQQGTFSNSSSLTSTYTLSSAEVAAGSVTLRLTGNAPSCNPVSDNVVITVTPSPSVNAGADQSNICFSPGTISLNGFSSTGSGTWSGGAGTFSSTTNLNAIYNSTVAERSGTVTLTLTSSNNGKCNPVTDQVSFNFRTPHTATISAIANSCVNNPNITLSGTTTSTGGQWSGGTGTYSPNANNINTTYIPSAAEIASGSVTFTLSPTGTGGCPPATSNVTVSILPSPTIVINGGTPISVCAGSPTGTLTAVLTGATGVTWSGGAGSFSSTTGTTVTYTATAAEVASGSVTLTGTTTGNGTCNPTSATAVINFQRVPVINAGSDIVLCGNSSVANLSATVTNATGVSWTHTGTGSLSSTTSLTPTYTPSVADKSTIVTFTATSTGNGVCSAVSDQMRLSFTVVPTADAGPDMTVCANDFPTQLNGKGSPSTWSGGAGAYSDPTDMSATYTPTAGEVGTTITLTLTTNPFGACPAVSDQMRLTIVAAPIANAGADQTICGNVFNTTLAGSVTDATGLFWYTDATGSFSNALSGTSTYAPSLADKTNGTVTLTLVTTGMTNDCPADSDQVVITITPTVTVFAGPDQTLCNNGSAIALTSGVVTGASGGIWTQMGGSGTLNNASSLTTASYTPHPADVSVTFTLTTTGNPAGCVALTDQLVITFTAPPVVNAGPDQTLCANAASVSLSGSVTNALGGIWTTTNGTGAFSPNSTNMNTTYVPGAGESGAITIRLTSSGNGVCPGNYFDDMIINLAPSPTVDAGINQVVCANNRLVTLSGIVTNATGGNWTSSGDGVFAAASSLNTTYMPGTGDVSAGSVTLTLTTTGTAPCASRTDVMVVQITPAPTINAGADRSVCANNVTLSLLGTVTVATGGTWSSSGAGVFSGTSSNGLATTYTPSAAEIAAGTATLTITSTDNGLCSPVSDNLMLTITPAPTVNAGPDVTICADSFYVQLNATYTVATRGIWSTSGTGGFFNSNATFDTATYVPSPADRNGGFVTLTFTTTLHGACNPVSDSKVVTITPAPTINAGADQTICSTTNTISVSAIKNTVSSGVLWTTSGAGNFVSNTSTSTTYNVAAIDKSAGAVILTVTTTGNGSCRAVSDQLTVFVVQQPIVNAGVDQTVCSDVMVSGIAQTPTVTNYASVLWSVTSGTGVFGPSNTTLNATYFPTAGDTTARSVTLQITAIANAPCANVSDSKVITLRPVPVIHAGSDIQVCNGSNAALSGAVTNASGGVWSLVAPASGTFAPSTSALNASYIPSPADTVAGSVRLVLTSTGMGTCSPVTDTMRISFRNRPTVVAIPNFSVCADAESFMISANTTNATGVQWTSSGTGGFTSSTSLSTMYFVTPQDSINGTVSFTVTTTGTNPCTAVSDNLTVSLTPVPTIDAGPDVNVCVNDTEISLNASVLVATGGFWTTTGTGSFSNSSILNPVYTFNPAEKVGPIVFKVTSTDNGACAAASDTMTVTFTVASVVNAGSDRTLCTTDLPVMLNGSGSAGQWSIITGDGVIQNALSASTQYDLGTTDSAIVTNPMILSHVLTFRYTPTGTCGGIPDDVTITLIQGPSITLNPISNICTNVNDINITGSASTAGTWATTGSGTFANNNIPTTYTMSAADKSSGSVILTFTIPAGGACRAFRDTLDITIHPTPTITAGPDKALCANALGNVTLNGAHTLSGTRQWNILNGMGSLSATNIDQPNYIPVAGDVGIAPVRLEYTIDNGICSVIRDEVLIAITAAPTLTIGNDTAICADMNLPLQATYTVSTGGIWTSSGTGIFTPDSQTDNPTYIPSSADTAAHAAITLTFTTTGNGICNAVSDSKILNLAIKPIVYAGIDDSICSAETSVALSGSVFHAPGVTWATTGTGTFSASNVLAPTYFPSTDDINNGGVIFTISTTGVAECLPVQDFKLLMIVPSPVATVNAGFDQVICRDEGSTGMTGFITIATGAKWDCQGSPCSGTFIPNDEDLFATYLPSAIDTANGSVILRLTTTTGNGICTPAFDEMLLTITDFPRPNAGADFAVCSDTSFIQLNGIINAEPLLQPAAYKWESSGSGVFTPNAFVANPQYIPSAADKANGSVGFTLNSLNNGTCDPRTDALVVTITTQPTINAGSDRATCANRDSVTMIGSMTVATTATWTSSGTGSFVATSANGLTTTYRPSAVDDANGAVVLTLTTTGGLGLCKSISDAYLLTINPAPIVNAGADQTICADNNSVNLSGIITNATGGYWRALGVLSTGGSGTFSPNTTSLNAIYDPSDSDTTRRFVRLVLESTGNGLCRAEDDTIVLTITPVPVVKPTAAAVCRITNGSQLTSSVVNALGGIWSTSGTGTFSANASVLNGIYYPSQADSAAGGVLLTLTSTGNGLCNAVSNTYNLVIQPVPIAVASPDQYVCAGVPITLTAQQSSDIGSYQWVRLPGTIVGGNASLTITPVSNEVYTLTAFRPDGCNSDKDTIVVSTFNMPASISLSGTNCLADSNVITATPVPAWPPVPGVYTWTQNGTVMGGQSGVVIFPNQTGQYQITFAAGACATTSNSFTINPSPIFAGIDKTNCANNATVLTALTPLAGSGSGFTYVWDTHPTITSGLNGQSVTVLYTAVFDTISYNVTVENTFGCAIEDSVYLITVEQPELAVQNDTACTGDTIVLSAVPTNYNIGNIPPIEEFLPRYVWTRDGIDLNVNNDTLVVTSRGRYIVNVIIGDCNNNTDTSDVLYNDKPVMSLPDNARFCDVTDSTVTLNAGVTAEPNKTYSYLWSPTGETTESIVTTIPGYHYVNVTANFGTLSCDFDDSVFVKIQCSPRVHIPNVFTPGATGANGFFQVFGTHFKNFKMSVYNRWGEVIYSTEDADFLWDGTYKDEPVPSGVYPYIIIYEGDTEENKGPYRIEGEILLMR